MKKLLRNIHRLPWKKQAKLFLEIANKNHHRLEKDSWTFESTHKLIKLCNNYINNNKASLKEFHNFLSDDSDNYIVDSSIFFQFDKKSNFKFPQEAMILSVICTIASFVAQQYGDTKEGIQEIKYLLEQDGESYTSYMGNFTIADPLEYARKGGLLDPEIFSQFGIDLKNYNLEEEASF